MEEENLKKITFVKRMADESLTILSQNFSSWRLWQCWHHLGLDFPFFWFFSFFSLFHFFFELRCQPHQPVLLLSARKIKRKKREKESNALNTKIKFFTVSAVSSVHFHWVFFTNLFLSFFTIGYAQENLWFISRKQRPWQAPEHYNPTVGEAGQEPKFVHA